MSKQTTTTRKAKGRRYSESEKRKVLAHVDEVNAERGRGGITAASKKFNITPLTISNWMRGGSPKSKAKLNGDAPAKLRAMAKQAKDFTRLADLIDQARALRAKLELTPIKTTI